MRRCICVFLISAFLIGVLPTQAICAEIEETVEQQKIDMTLSQAEDQEERTTEYDPMDQVIVDSLIDTSDEPDDMGEPPMFLFDGPEPEPEEYVYIPRAERDTEVSPPAEVDGPVSSPTAEPPLQFSDYLNSMTPEETAAWERYAALLRVNTYYSELAGAAEEDESNAADAPDELTEADTAELTDEADNFATADEVGATNEAEPTDKVEPADEADNSASADEADSTDEAEPTDKAEPADEAGTSAISDAAFFCTYAEVSGTDLAALEDMGLTLLESLPYAKAALKYEQSVVTLLECFPDLEMLTDFSARMNFYLHFINDTCEGSETDLLLRGYLLEGHSVDEVLSAYCVARARPGYGPPVFACTESSAGQPVRSGPAQLRITGGGLGRAV